jgi:sulfatase maturation enzyme AslB (radical SAM superfamily)
MKEYKKIGILDPKHREDKHKPRFDLIKYENLKQIYIAGGEPTVISELYQWLDQCIKDNQTDFAIEFNTNGTNITNRLKKLLPHFREFNFIFSIDGYRDLNRYIRWPSDWDTVINNWRYLKDHGHSVTLNITISIYNISRLSEFFAFIDREFPGTLVHPSLVNIPSHMSPFLFPYPELVLQDLKKVKQTQSHKKLDFTRTVIDNFIDFYSQPRDINILELKKFFAMNDKLDQSRSVNLKDYLPTLDSARHLIYNHQ